MNLHKRKAIGTLLVLVLKKIVSILKFIKFTINVGVLLRGKLDMRSHSQPLAKARLRWYLDTNSFHENNNHRGYRGDGIISLLVEKFHGNI